MTKLLKSTRGITLIALVITIIVLLILAGVALSLVLGENGITNRAVNAGKTQNMAGAKEKLELDVANYGAEFYQAKYVNGSLPNNADTIQKYIMSKFTDNTPYADGYTLTIPAENQLKLTENFDGETYAIATIGSDGKVSWGAIVTPVANPGGGSSGGDTPSSSGTTLADITSANYGDYIDLGTSILPADTTIGNSETIKSDWRIFYKDSEGNVYAKLADYLPVDTGIGASVASSLRLDTYGKYGVYADYSGDYADDYNQDYDIEDRDIFLGKLNANWNGLLSGSDITTIQNGLGTKINVKGAVDLPTWVASWNSNTDYTKLFANYDSDENAYMIGTSSTDNNSLIDLSTEQGYNNTLYFPHKEAVNDCNRYWLASSGPGDADFGGIIWYLFYNGYPSTGSITFTNQGGGVCPVVILSSDIPVEEGQDGVWEVQ